MSVSRLVRQHTRRLVLIAVSVACLAAGAIASPVAAAGRVYNCKGNANRERLTISFSVDANAAPINYHQVSYWLAPPHNTWTIDFATMNAGTGSPNLFAPAGYDAWWGYTTTAPTPRTIRIALPHNGLSAATFSIYYVSSTTWWPVSCS